MSDDDKRKLIVREDNGELLLEAVMNGKGYRKSLETGQLWTLHPETGRLLPLGGGVGFLSLSETEDGLEATIDTRAAQELIAAGTTQAAHTARVGASANVQPVDTGATTEAIVSDDVIVTDDNGGIPSVFAELAILEKTVFERKSDDQVEGSYTSYLFSEGEQKIRKKLGEEAIELCLAQENDRIVSESADLLYHLSVLLASRDLSYADVLGELKRRRES